MCLSVECVLGGSESVNCYETSMYDCYSCILDYDSIIENSWKIIKMVCTKQNFFDAGKRETKMLFPEQLCNTRSHHGNNYIIDCILSKSKMGLKSTGIP